jgi:hypothetical protein
LQTAYSRAVKRTPLASFVFLFVFSLLSTINASAQLVSIPPDSCKSSGTLTVTVTNERGGAIPNALVLLRHVTFSEKPTSFLESTELRTNARGVASGLVPCGYADLFVASDKFAPHAEKLELLKDRESVTVALKTRGIATY